MLKVLLIDDEMLALNLLEYHLKELEWVKVVGKFTSFEKGLETILTQKLHLIFLDIEMQSDNGINVAEQIQALNKDIEIIFVTAYDQYALEAFRVSAVDYLLKPIDPERLKHAVEKMMKRRNIAIAAKSLKAQFFGHFILKDVQNSPIKWRTKKVKELCAYLLHRQEPIHRLKIIEDFWPDIPLESATSLLHTTVYQLRKQLKSYGFENPISLEDERYAINIDVVNDNQRVNEIIKHKAFDESSVMLVKEALEKGYLGLEDYPWSISYEEDIREQCSRFLRNYLNEHANSKPILWEQVLETLVKQDPYNEAYHQELINHYLELGNTTRAAAVYRMYKESLD